MKKLLLTSASLFLLTTTANAYVYRIGSIDPEISGGTIAGDYIVPSGTTLQIAVTADGELTVQSGLIQYENAHIAIDGEGLLIAQGASSSIVSTGTTIIAYSDRGYLNITDNATFTGVDVVAGAGGRGDLNASNGSTVNITNKLTIGPGNSSRLHLLSGSTANIKELEVINTTGSGRNIRIDQSTGTFETVTIRDNIFVGTIIGNASNFIVTNSFELGGGSFSLLNSSTTDFTSADVLTYGNGAISISSNSTLNLNNAKLNGTLTSTNGFLESTGTLELAGSNTFTDSTITTADTILAPSHINHSALSTSLDNTSWINTNDITFSNASGTTYTLNATNGTTIQTRDFITGTAAGSADINLNSSSTISARDFILGQDPLSVTNLSISDANTILTSTRDFKTSNSTKVDILNSATANLENSEFNGTLNVIGGNLNSTGNFKLAGISNFNNATLTTDNTFLEPSQATYAGLEVNLNNTTWNNTNDITFNNATYTNYIFNATNNSTINFQDFVTGANDGSATITLSSGSVMNGQNYILSQNSLEQTHIILTDANTTLNSTGDIAPFGPSYFSIQVFNNAHLNVSGTIYLGQGGDGDGRIIIGNDQGLPPLAAGTVTATNGIVFDGMASDIYFNHTANNYVFSQNVSSIGLHPNHRITNENGITTITGNYGDYHGTYTVNSGELHLKGTQPLNQDNYLEIQDSGHLYLYGNNQTVNEIYISGTLYLDTSTNLNLTINNNFSSFGNAKIVMETTLGDDTSPGDRILIKGDTYGVSQLQITNRNGLGALTSDGIKLITVQGQSNGVFTLIGDTTYLGEPVILGGAYSYALHKGSLDGASDLKSWYLRSFDPTGGSGTNPQTGPNPAPKSYSPVAALMEAYPQTLQELNRLGDLDTRSAHHFNSDGNKYGLWLYTDAHHNAVRPRQTTTDTKYKLNSYEMRGGIDIPVYSVDSGQLILGIGARYINGRTKTDHIKKYMGTGSIKTEGYGVIPTLTWYGSNGFYVDAVFQATRYESDITAHKLKNQIAHNNKSNGYASSLEVGQSFPLNDRIAFTLQGQVMYAHTKYDGFTDTNNAAIIKDGKSNTLSARIGGGVNYAINTDTTRNNMYAKLDIFNDFKNRTKATIAEITGNNPADITAEGQRTWAGLSIGGTHSWRGGKYNLYGELGATTAFKKASDNYSMGGTIGFSYRF